MLANPLRKKTTLPLFEIALVLSLLVPVSLLYFLDYTNIEILPRTVNSDLILYFNLTWKGRMFYLFFIWIFVLEAITDWRKISSARSTRPRMTAALIMAAAPVFYIVSLNFLGLDSAVLQLAQMIGPIKNDFLIQDWPISFEYLILGMFWLVSILLAYGKTGLKTFAISLGLLWMVGLVYTLDTIFPFGVLKPLQALALPTAATATGIMDLLGYQVMLTFPERHTTAYGIDLVPRITILADAGNHQINQVSLLVAWPCAGVQSLFLFILIFFLFMMRSSLSQLHKVTYFFVGLIGTFMVNVARVISISLVMLYSGQAAGMAFHNTYGELYFLAWMGFYILLIVLIEKYGGRLRLALSTLPSRIKKRTTLILPSQSQQP